MGHKRALVTGACGFVGSHLVERLDERCESWDVVATDLERAQRRSYYADGTLEESTARPQHRYYGDFLEESGARFVPADLTDRSSLEPLFEESYDVVFHTASLFDYFAERETLDAVNVEGGRNVGALAAANDVGQFVHWSTLGVCGGTDVTRDTPATEDVPYDPHNRYGRSKRRQEEALFELRAQTDLPLTVLRPAPIYGPRHQYGIYHLLLLYRKVGTGLVFPIYPRERQFRFPCVHVEDLVRAAVFVHEHRERTVGETYHVTSDPIRQDELVEFVAESLGLPRRRVPLPWPVYRTVAGWLVGLASSLERRAREQGRTPKFPASMARYLTNDFWFTNRKLREEGFEFVYEDPRHGLWDYITWCKERGLL
ncbi:NAD-dependent epimerase/dehydratase family protein [Halomarina oriensis]|uniref:NAD-dependent epimerase/dehydratase family protein n=1 Tax=Halomarina oriensis TaxID=671145 RepID=A0A6B0GVH0_9EURY|nr:NAD-dependent epimerase/dehydratase family protein [Halomarina oriensis]